MADYSKATNFSVKDTLSTGDPNKIVSGAEIDTEFDNIAVASGTKADKVSGATSGNVAQLDTNGNLADAGFAVSNLSTDVITTEGDLVVGNGSGEESRFAIGTANRSLISNGTTVAWSLVDTNNIATDAVTSAKIAANAVGQSELKTANGEVTFSVVDPGSSGSSTATRTLPGGTHSYRPESRFTESASSISGTATFEGYANSSTYGQYVTIRIEYTVTTGSGTVTTYLRQTYVQASPPYSLGNGDIPLFIFAHMLPDGSVEGVYVAEDPPWANNGPTNIRPDFVDPDTGKKYKREKKSELTIEDVKAGKASMQELISARQAAKEVLVEITPELKNKDISLIPHPFPGDISSGEIVLIDPVGHLTHKLHEIHNDGESISDIIHNGYVEISNENSGSNGTPKARAVKARFKNSKRQSN